MNKRVCENCRWWENDQHAIGVCFRHAPKGNAPRLEDVANLTSSGATVVSVGSICVLLSTALTVVVSQSQNIRPIVMPNVARV